MFPPCYFCRIYSTPAAIITIASMAARKYDGRKKASKTPTPNERIMHPRALNKPERRHIRIPPIFFEIAVYYSIFRKQ